MGRSYLRYVSALLVLLVLVLPLAAATVHAYIAPGGRGVVFTSTVGVGGQVEFFFNLTGQTWIGPTGYIYLSSNGNDYLTMGDTQISKPFTATNSSVIAIYIVGNITITVQDVENFIENLEIASEQYPTYNPNASYVLNHLREYGWAYVYLKFATSTPSTQYTARAIAAGPFNLTLKPAFAVRPYFSSYMSYYNCTVNDNKYGIYTVSQQSINLTGLPAGIINYLEEGKNFTISAVYENFLTGLTSASVQVYAYTKGTPSSNVFTSASTYEIHGDNLTIPSAELSSSFAPPVLTAVPGTYLNGFNMSVWTLDENSGTFVVPALSTTPGKNKTVVFNGGSSPYTYTSSEVVSTNLTLSVSNVNATGLAVSASAYVEGWLDVLPSFNFAWMVTGVAGPANQLNPDDIVNVTLANMPKNSVLTSVQAVGNESLLPTEPIAVFEWNEGYWSKLEGFYLTGNMTNVTGPVTGATAHSIAIVIPNAPYGLPFSYLGLYLGFTYTAQLANGSTPGFTSAVYGSASSTCLSKYAVYPFMQVFTSNEYGLFLYNQSLLLGNYLLVRGFGFPAGTYSDLTLEFTTTSGTYAALLTPLSGTLETDQYGDFVYITQVPYSGPFANAIASAGPGTWSIAILAKADLNATAYSVLVPSGLGDALIYVQPTPTTWDNTSYALPTTENPASVPITSFSVPTSNSELDLPNIYGVISMPASLVRFPYEATEYMVNGTTALIPSWEGGIEDVVIVGAPLSSPMDLTAYFFMGGYPAYFNSVNLSALPSSDYEVPFTNGYTEIGYLPVPDLPGTVTYYSSPAYGYAIELHNVSTGQFSESAYSEVFVATAAEILVEPTNFNFATLIVNYTSSSNPLGLPSLYTNGTSGSAKYFLYLWPPYALGYVNYLLLLPGTSLEVYIFGSPVSYNTTYTLTNPTALPVYVTYGCSVTTGKALIGYIINGTLWSSSLQVKGGTFNPELVLCTTGTYVLSFQVVGPWVPTTTTAYVPHEPVNVNVYYVAPNQVPAVAVPLTIVGSGSTVNAGEPYVVLVPSQVPILGLEPSVAKYFFIVSAPSVQAYVLGKSGAVVAVPSTNIMMVGTMDGYYVYEITVPSNVTYGQLVVIASESAEYLFTGQTFTGTAAAEMGIVPTTNSTAIEQAVSQALAQLEKAILANVTEQLNEVESTLLAQLQLLGDQVAAAQHAIAYGIVGNATTIEQEISTVTASEQAIANEIHSLGGYMASNFSETLAYLSNINTTLSQVRVYLPNLATLVEEMHDVSMYIYGNFSAINATLHDVSMYIYGNFSAINATLQGIQSDISTLEGDVTAVGSEVGAVGANVLTLLHDAQTLSGYAEATLSYLSSMNSTLTSVSSSLSTLSSIQSSLSSVNSKLDSISSTLSSVSSGVSSVQGTLSSMSSTLSSVSSGVSSIQSTLSSVSSTISSMSSTLSSVSTTASNAYSETQHVASVASTAATYALGALVVAVIALALIAYVAFAKF